MKKASDCDLLLIIGSTGEVGPANMLPPWAKKSGAMIIEVNTETSNYTDSVTDIFLQGKATEVMQELMNHLEKYNAHTGD